MSVDSSACYARFRYRMSFPAPPCYNLSQRDLVLADRGAWPAVVRFGGACCAAGFACMYVHAAAAPTTARRSCSMFVVSFGMLSWLRNRAQELRCSVGALTRCVWGGHSSIAVQCFAVQLFASWREEVLASFVFHAVTTSAESRVLDSCSSC